ncbi:MAG: Ig-like domain-containing protein [Patescibacteria group bacterium]
MKILKNHKIINYLVIINFCFYQIVFLLVPSTIFLNAEIDSIATTSDKSSEETKVLNTNEDSDTSTSSSDISDDILFTDEPDSDLSDKASEGLPLEITFMERMDSPFSGDKRITISPNQTIDKADFFIKGQNEEWHAGTPEPSGDYYFIWKTADYPDGSYVVSAAAYKNGDQATISFSADVKNETGISEEQKNVANNRIDTIDLYKSFDEKLEIVEPVKEITEVEKSIDYNNDEHIVNTKNYINNAPKYYPDESFENKKEFLDEPFYDIAHEEKFIREPIIFPECKENNINYEPDCKEFMLMSPECRAKGFKSKTECEGFLFTPPECREKDLSQEDCDKLMRLPHECQRNNILDPQKCKDFMYESSMPYECKQAGVTNPEKCNKIMRLGKMTIECQEAGISSLEKCEEFMHNQFLLTPECQSNRIHDPISCKIFMAKEFMPKECQEAGVTTKEECDYLLRNQYQSEDFKEMIEITRGEVEFFKDDTYYDMDKGMPRECQEAGIITPEECERIMFTKKMPKECEKVNASTIEECDKIMFVAHMPYECQEAGIIDPEGCRKHMDTVYMPPECREVNAQDMEECEKIIFKKHAPPECVKANILEPEACDKHMFEMHVPDDCLENGIKTGEACKKFMFEKYGDKEKMPLDKLPIECQKAGADSIEKCDEVMRGLYMPGECKDKGIKDEGACEYYLKQKYMPTECREAGAETRSKCDKIMFNKYAPSECKEAGIENDKDCEEFMFSKYSQKIKCEGLDDWQCENSIKDRHIGNIVAKQAKFMEVKEKVLSLAGESLKLEKIKEKLEISKDIIPTTREQATLKILPAKEILSLNENDNLTQTGPVAFMIDSDGDGLPDDLEIRLGTDPNNKDSDNDGYLDGAELKNKFNPLGEGVLDKTIAPIDEAIVGNKTLGHPKAEGEESEELSIKNIINVIDDEDADAEGYDISGMAKPNSVATLYIYSDLPVVVTVNADEYGNWQYKFDQSLVEGEHEIYVAVNDNTGRVVKKSSPLNFFIKEAKAISITDFVSPATSATLLSSIEKDFLLYYIIGGAVIFIGLGGFILFYYQNKRKYER